MRRKLSLCYLKPLTFLLALFTIPATGQDLENGQQLFQTLCARCHGMLGEGGEGPSLTRPNLIHAPDDDELESLIEGGNPRNGKKS